MTDASPPAARNPLGWIALGVLLLFAVTSLATSFSKAPSADVRVRWISDLRTALTTREIDRRFGFPGGDAWFRRAEARLAPYRKSPEWDAYWVAIRTELGEKTTFEDERRILDSKEPGIHDIGEAYTMRPAPKEWAVTLARKLDERGPLSRLAAVHLKTAAGLPDPRATLRRSGDRYLLAMALGGVVGVGSLLAWIALLVAGSSGTLPDLGPPYVVPTLANADRLAVKAALLFLGFEVVSTVWGLSVKNVPLRTVLSGLSMFAVVPLVLRGGPSFEAIVGAREGLGRKLLFGLWAFFLEIPVTMIVAAVGERAFSGLPQNEHPAAVALMNTHDPLLIGALLFFGAVSAPFWEETMFRGLLFPALRKTLGNPVAGALVSSFVFACVHPQGPGGWLGLIAFALCSCVLASRTRSLVPSMAMHAAHNGTLLVLALLLGG